MNKFILNIEKWFNSDEDVKLTFKNHIDDFGSYSIDKDIFLYDEFIVRDKLVNNCITSYFKRIEQYINIYSEKFSFNDYCNFADAIETIDNDTVMYFLEWFKEENIDNIKRFNEDSAEYNIKHFYSVIKYYDFLINSSLENKNYEATLDFLVEFIDNIMDRTLELSNKEIYDQVVNTENIKAKVPEANVPINKEYLIVNADEHLLNNFEYKFESANQQAFLLEIIDLFKLRRRFKWTRFQMNNIMTYN